MGQFLTERVKSKQYNENKKKKQCYLLLANGNFVLLEGVICAVGLQSMKD